ncbi:MAG TPA: ABC transporter ATP-binding protein [Rubrivivax sp.]|nr:ABC transporter ATP-binding protein [Rubrivivax sp.]
MTQAEARGAAATGARPALPPDVPPDGPPGAPSGARPGAPMLEVAGVSRSFRGLRAVSRASLTVARGEIVALIGPNGAGKTTLFNLVAGALAPDEGSIRFQGAEIAGLRADRVCAVGIGRTFQIVKPFADMTVLENAMVGGFRGTTDPRLARARAERALQALDMWPERHRPASALTLPGGKRLEVARALATEPSLLLLDEVMAGLRPTETDRMVAAFRRLNAEHGVTILLIEHVMRAVMALAERVYVLHHGEIIAAGTPQQVTSDPRVLHSYLGSGAAPAGR